MGNLMRRKSYYGYNGYGNGYSGYNGYNGYGDGYYGYSGYNSIIIY